MPDKISKEQRSYVMSQIRGKGTKPETLVFKYLRAESIYFQKHYSKVPGNPDIAIPRKKLAVFIDGDFWHGYDLERRKGTLPHYWAVKITRNVVRDRATRRELQNRGWKIMRVWEHELSKKSYLITLERIKEFLAEDTR